MTLISGLVVVCILAAVVSASSGSCTLADEGRSLLQKNKLSSPERSSRRLSEESQQAPSKHLGEAQQHDYIAIQLGSHTHAGSESSNSSAAFNNGMRSQNVQYSDIAALLVGLMLFMAILPILWNSGKIPFMVVLTYLTCLTFVKFAVKQTINNGYSYPYTITAFHMLGTAMAAVCFERPRTLDAIKVLPVSLMNGASLALANTALVYGGVAFTSMIASCAPAPAYLLEVLARRRNHWSDGFLGTLLVCVGSVICVRGEATASLLCFLLAAGATVFRALKSTTQQELLAVNVSPMVMVFWSGFWSFCLLIPLIMFTEGSMGLTSLRSIPPAALSGLLVSVVCATMLNICQVFAVKQLGSLQQVTVGNLNCIMAIVLASAMRGEQVHAVQYLGTFLVMLGAPLSKKSPAPPPSAQEKAKNTEPPAVEQKTTAAKQ